jgi:hypothetical protein
VQSCNVGNYFLQLLGNYVALDRFGVRFYTIWIETASFAIFFSFCNLCHWTGFASLEVLLPAIQSALPWTMGYPINSYHAARQHQFYSNHYCEIIIYRETRILQCVVVEATKYSSWFAYELFQLLNIASLPRSTFSVPY